MTLAMSNLHIYNFIRHLRVWKDSLAVAVPFLSNDLNNCNKKPMGHSTLLPFVSYLLSLNSNIPSLSVTLKKKVEIIIFTGY